MKNKLLAYALAALLISCGTLACCTVEKTFLYKPGDTVRVGKTRFIIVRPAAGHIVRAYDVINLKNNRYLPGLSQRGLKPLKHLTHD